MTQPGPHVSRRLAVLFAVAVLGVIVMVGLVVATTGVVPLFVAYVALAVLLLVAAVRRARALQRPAGRTCSCCTSTVYDPVEVR